MNRSEIRLDEQHHAAATEVRLGVLFQRPRHVYGHSVSLSKVPEVTDITD